MNSKHFLESKVAGYGYIACVLLKKNFCYTLFLGISSSERLRHQIFFVKDKENIERSEEVICMRSTKWLPWKNWKCSRRMAELCFSNLNLSMKDNFLRHVPSAFSEKLFYKVLNGAYLFREQNTCYFDSAPQGLLSKQRHSPKVVLGKNCSEKLPNFYRIKPLMKSFLS